MVDRTNETIDRAYAAYDAFAERVKNQDLASEAIQDVYQAAATVAGVHVKALSSASGRKPVHFEVACFGAFCIAVAALPSLGKHKRFFIIPSGDDSPVVFNGALVDRLEQTLQHSAALQRFQMYADNLRTYPDVGLYDNHKRFLVPASRMADQRLGCFQFARGIALAIDPDFYNNNPSQGDFVPIGRKVALAAHEAVTEVFQLPLL